MRITQGTFSFLPDLTDEQIAKQVDYALAQGWAVSIEYSDDPHPRNTYWEMWGMPMFDLKDAAGVVAEIRACRKPRTPTSYIKLNAFDSTLGFETMRLSFMVHRPQVRRLATSCAARRVPDVSCATRSSAPEPHGMSRTFDLRALLASPASTRCSTSSTAISSGWSPVKLRIREIASLLVVDKARAELGVAVAKPSLHMCFTGNPGTGKTTVAMRMATILHRLGHVRKGHLVAVTRDDLVGPVHRPHRPKTREVLKRIDGRRAVHRRGLLPVSARRTSATTARKRSRS